MRSIVLKLPLVSIAEDEGDDLDRPTFSLITGKYRQPKLYGSKHDLTNLTLAYI